MVHRFVIKKTDSGQYRAYFYHNKEAIFWTETYTRKDGARNAIESIKKNGPDAEVEED